MLPTSLPTSGPWKECFNRHTSIHIWLIGLIVSCPLGVGG